MYVNPYLCGELAVVGITVADAPGELPVAFLESLGQCSDRGRSLGGAEESVEALPLGEELLLAAIEFAADDADGVGGDAGMEAARAGDVGHDLFVEEGLDGVEEFVVGGAVLHGLGMEIGTRKSEIGS